MDTILTIMIRLQKKYKLGSALEILQEAILFGNIPCGEVITQNDLAVSLGISRMPVREALIVLEYQGLIERLPTQHIRVINFEDSYIRSIFNDLTALEIEAIKILPDESLNVLTLAMTQQDFHRSLTSFVNAPLRRKFIQTITEIYIAFVINNSCDIGKIDKVFANLQQVLTKSPVDISVLRACYSVYSEVLASEFIRIRRNKQC